MKYDRNICPDCGCSEPLDAAVCRGCGGRLLLPAKGAIAMWRLGQVRGDLLDGVVHGVAAALGMPIVVQPALLDPRPSHRSGWCGVSASAFLNQVHRRAIHGAALNVGITERNVVPGSAWNFVFGYARMDEPACVVSLHPLSLDKPRLPLLIKRATAIILHEIGHNCGLEHHDYEDGIHCSMTADTERDSLELLDNSSSKFCRPCRKRVEERLNPRRRKGG